MTTDDHQPKRFQFSILLLNLFMLHAALAAAVYVFLTRTVPSYKSLFIESQLAMPYVTLLVLDLSDFMIRYWGLIVLPVALGDLLVLLLLDAREQRVRLLTIYTGVVVVIVAGVLGFAYLCLEMPLRATLL